MLGADTYSKANKQSTRYAEVCSLLKTHEGLLSWKPEERILDVGCGPGDATIQVLLPRIPPDFELLLGVDVSPSMVKHALVHHTGDDRIAFLTADIGSDISHIVHDERYSKGFDKIFSLYVLHWLQDLQRGVDNLYSLLRPGGQTLLLFPVDRVFQKACKKVGAKESWNTYLKGETRTIPPFPRGPDASREFRELLSTVGFEVAKCVTFDQPSTFQSVTVLKDLIKSLSQDIDCIPQHLKDQYLQDCVEEMEAMNVIKIEEQRVCIKQLMLLSIARKPA